MVNGLYLYNSHTDSSKLLDSSPGESDRSEAPQGSVTTRSAFTKDTMTEADRPTTAGRTLTIVTAIVPSAHQS